MIEKIIHQVWVGPYRMPDNEKRYIENIKKLHPEYDHRLWTEMDDSLPENLKESYEKLFQTEDYAFCADILRLWYVYKYGGFYLDVDWDIKKPLDSFFSFDAVFFTHNGTDYTIPNGGFAAKKNSPLLKYCIDTTSAGWRGPSWFGETIKRHAGFTYETPHDVIKNYFSSKNICYFSFSDFESEYGKHTSLYSWSPEIKLKFKKNEQ